MRIGVFSDNLAEHPWTGVGNYLHYLVREWARAHEVWGIGRKRLADAPGFAGHIRMGWWNWNGRREIEQRADVLLCPLPRLVPDYFYELDKPKLVTIHGAEPFLFAGTALSEPPSENVLRLRERQGEIDLFLTVSRSAQKEIVAHYGIPPERLLPIYHGVDPQVFFPPADKEAGRQKACAKFGIPGRYLLHVSNYRPRKNVPRLLAAYELLCERGYSELTLVMAGRTRGGFEEATAEARAQARGRIVHLGQMPVSDLAELYQGAEVFLFPSLHEGFGLPPLEAMACGVPAVVSNVYALPEVTGDAALQVNPESVEEIAQATARLLTDPGLYEKQRQVGLARSREFRWDVSARQHLEAFARARELYTARKAKSR